MYGALRLHQLIPSGFSHRHLVVFLLALAGVLLLTYSLILSGPHWSVPVITAVEAPRHAAPGQPKHHDDIAPLQRKTSRVGKVMMVLGEGETLAVYERTLRTHKLHNKMHGYPMFVQRVPLLETAYWSKPATILGVILSELGKAEEHRLQWLFWVDADTVLLNYKSALENFLPPDDDDSDFKGVHFVMTDDHNGLNNGVFAVRVSSVSVEVLSAIIALRHFRPNVELPWPDQTAQAIVLGERPYNKGAVKVPQLVSNASLALLHMH
ncbi:hypothetical protein CDD83_2723 [Cordyceps sp. RAO-2017]|nr:hypothetical protein CDD83_2723 [Cordyceps sp. RAO-2017]